MKNILMSAQMRLASVRTEIDLPRGGQVFRACGAAAPVPQNNPARFRAEAGRWFAPADFPAASVPAVLTFTGDSHAAMTKHIGNGGLRGPQPWRHPPVII